jgi:hypothetical protein
MNWRRGFGRITLALGITVAICCATFAVFVVNGESQTARYYLESKHEIYENHWGLDIFDRVAAETDKNEEKFYYFGDPNVPFLILDSDPMASFPKEELKKIRVRDAEELKDLRKGFWVTLSRWQLLGLYIIGGLAGGAVGFYGVWLIYYLIEWLILGFL